MYKLIIEKDVSKFLLKHKWEKLISIFKEKFILLSENPYRDDLDIKAIIWKNNQYRLRIWKYRFLYEINEDIITISVFNADSRWLIYK